MLLLAAGLGLGGCGGEFILSVPDTVTAMGQDAPVVVRLQQQEFWKLTPALKDALLQMWVLPDRKRAAYTGKAGYAATTVPTPEAAGRYTLTVCHQDHRGDEISRTGSVFVLDDRRAVLAVDWEAIDSDEGARAAVEPLRRLQQAGIQIVYLSAERTRRPGEAHQWLAEHNLPDGAVISWGWRRNWYRKAVQVTGAMPIARRMLPGMLIAAGREDDFLRAAEMTGMLAVHVGTGRAKQFGEVGDWATLADRITKADTLKGAGDFSKVTPAQVRASVLGGG